MRQFFCTLVFIAAGAIDGSVAQAQTTDASILLSAASKKKPSPTQPAGQIACTIAGCQRIPPNCHPEMGYNWDGIPTGFDIVVCRPPRGRREF